MRVWTDVTEVTAILPDGDGCLVAGRCTFGVPTHAGYRFHGVFRLDPAAARPRHCFGPSRRPAGMSWVPRPDGSRVLQIRTPSGSSSGWWRDDKNQWWRLWHAPLWPAVGFNRRGKPLFLAYGGTFGSFDHLAVLRTAAGSVPRRPEVAILYDRAVVVGAEPTVRLVGNAVDPVGIGSPVLASVLYDTAAGRWARKSTTTVPNIVGRGLLATGRGALVYARNDCGSSSVIVVGADGQTAPAPAYLPPYDCWDTLDWVGDAAAWLDEGVLKVATADGVAMSLRPNQRRRLRGCALAPDGQTVWAYDTGAVYQIDVG